MHEQLLGKCILSMSWPKMEVLFVVQVSSSMLDNTRQLSEVSAMASRYLWSLPSLYSAVEGGGLFYSY